MEHYGIIKEIISLQCLGRKQMVLLNCDWCDMDKRDKNSKMDKHDFASLNTRIKLKTKKTYVLSSQARQVFYVRDGYDPSCLVVFKTQP